MKRLFALVLAALWLVACFEVDQKIVLHASGGVSHSFRLTHAKPPREGLNPRGQALLDAVNGSPLGERVRAWVEVDGGSQIWAIEARLVSTEEYQVWREAAIAAMSDRYLMDIAWLRPPEITGRWARELHLVVDPELNETPTAGPPHPEHIWRLTVVMPRPPASHNADRVEPDGALVWERPMRTVLLDGVQVSAVESMPWAWIGLGLGGLGVAVALAGLALRLTSSSRGPGQPRSSAPS